MLSEVYPENVEPIQEIVRIFLIAKEGLIGTPMVIFAVGGKCNLKTALSITFLMVHLNLHHFDHVQNPPMCQIDEQIPSSRFDKN